MSEQPAESNEHQIVKELSNPHKEFRFLGMDLERRQFMILAGMLAPIAIIYRLEVFAMFNLTPAQVTAVIAPFVLLGLAFAFLKWEGRDLSFIAAKRLRGLVRNTTLVWRGKPPGSVMWLRDSVQRYLPAEEPVWEMLKTNNGTYLRIIEVEESSLGLASEEEQENNRAQLADGYIAMDFDITEITRSRPSAMGTYLARLQDEVAREVGRPGISEEEAIKVRAFADDHIGHLKELVSESEAYEHKSYIIITYNPSREEVSTESPLQQMKGLFASALPFLKKKRASKKKTKKAQVEADLAWRTLQHRVGYAIHYYGRRGLILRPLGEKEALEFLREEAGGSNLQGVRSETGGNAESRTPMRIGLTTTLTDDAFKGLSRKAIAKRIDAAEEVRGSEGDDSPPVVGLGELSVNDRIAPDAVQIHSDHLVVGTSYHRTLYIYDLPESVRNGFLQPLADLKRRIKVVKFIRKVPTNEALKFIGKKKSQLLAAEKTTSQGNVLDRLYKEQARKSANYAHEEVQGLRQSYHQLAVLIHLEADSKEELDELTDTVRDTLDARYAANRLALEEMWEGYCSCLPLGENHLLEKYCSSGILTKPLSCFATFSSVEINHDEGVLFGTDQSTNALVRYDRRKANNRHMLIWGASGMGKTVLVKSISTRSRIRGETQILIDPEGNTRYEAVAREIGGQFVKLGKGGKSRINPFDLGADYPDLSLLADEIEDGEDPDQVLHEARSGAFTSKVGTIVTLIGIMSTAESAASTTAGLDASLRGPVERVIAEVYADAGITEDPETHHNTPPTMPEFFEKLAVYATEDEELAGLFKRLYSWHTGGLRHIFSGQTNVDLHSKYLVIRTSTNKYGAETAPLQFVLLDYLSGRLADPREAITCWLDEFWSLLRYPMAAEHLSRLWRASRASGTSMVGITQDIEEFTTSEHVETIMNQSQTYVLLGQNKKFVERIGEYVEIDEATRKRVQRFSRGEALLIAGQRQMRLDINISEHEKEIFHTDAAALSSGGGSAAELTGAAGGPGNGSGEDRSNGPDNGGDGKPTVTAAAAGGPSRKASDERPATRTPARKKDEPPSMREIAPRVSTPPGARAGDDLRDGGIYAIGGPSATQVGFALSGMLAVAATRHETGGRVLFVDAAKTLSTTALFAGIELPPTDWLIEDVNPGAANHKAARKSTASKNGGGRIERDLQLEDYLIRDHDSGLCVLRYPEDDSIEAEGLAGYLGRHFDAVIVAVSKRPGGNGGGHRWPDYARDWVLSASAVGAAASSAEALTKAVAGFEDLGDFNTSPLLALTTGGNGSKPGKELARDTLTLPPADELAGAMGQGVFLPVEEPEEAGGFARLAQRLIR
jgi:hypothetical protein